MKTFDFGQAASPTFIQLRKHLIEQGWELCPNAMLTLQNFNMDERVTQTLEFKHLLAGILSENIHPQTFYIDDHNWQTVLSGIPDQTWILKPSLLNNGQHIHIFASTNAVWRHYLGSSRMGGPHVLQAYLKDPHLLKGPQRGHKYSLRMFWVLTGNGNAYLYPHGYFNVALKPYEKDDFSQLGCHLTNEHLSHDTYNVVQIPSFQYALFQPFFPQIQAILCQVNQQINQRFSKVLAVAQIPQFSLFGVDFMVDQNEKVWLIEMNHGPCFPIGDEHPLQHKLYSGFWQALIKELIEPSIKGAVIQLQSFVRT